ncbi:urease accessory protein UreD [Pseudovibrio axinellae]|nr:urease accessory protein UreD [Pseudovibrio axinellae]
MQRAFGVGRVSFKAPPSPNAPPALDELYQEGAAKIRLPKVYSDMAEAALINTSGGLTGGDIMNWRVDLHANTKAVISTQACEKIYRASEDTARVTNDLVVGENAELHWLPQETILFNEASLTRKLHVELAPSARFVGVEAIILGRQAMGEQVESAFFKDSWRVHRGGKLLHADELSLSGSVAELSRNAAVLNGARAFASLLFVAPEDQEVLNARARTLQCEQDRAVTALSAFNGKLVGRVAAADGFALRQALIPLLSGLREGYSLPKLWNL